MEEVLAPSPKQFFVENWWLTPKHANKTAIIADGAIRTGKTVWMSLGYIQWAMYSFDNCDFIIAGKTILSLRRNVVKKLKDRLHRLGYSITDHKSENMLTITFGNHSNQFYLFGGKDEGSQDLVQGLTAAGVYFDEVALMPQSFVNQATGRCLTVKGHKYWFNCNPAGPTHYFKREWIDNRASKDAIRVHFLMKDNPILDEKTIKQASNMYSGAFYDRYILGQWATAEGVIYPDFSKDDNMIEPEFIPPIYELQVMAGVDFGYHHFTSIVVVGYHPATKKYYLLNEITHMNREIDYWTQKAHEIQRKYGDIPFYCDSARPEHVDHFTNHDINALYADKSVSPGIEAVGGLIKSNRLLVSMNEYDLTKEDTLADEPQDSFIQEIYEYVWKPGQDEPLKEHDHVLDALRYVIFAFKELHENELETYAV